MKKLIIIFIILLFVATAYAKIGIDLSIGLSPEDGTVGGPVTEGDSLLLEIGDYFLLENDDKLLLE